MDSLLPFYERELIYLRQLSQEFALRYPSVAGGLLLSGETCGDPHIERLIEGFAFLAARIHKRIEDDIPEISDTLLEAIYPQLLKPFPSVGIAQFDGRTPDHRPPVGGTIRRGTMFRSSPVDGVCCRFRTAYDVRVLPVTVSGASCHQANEYRSSASSSLLSGHGKTTICIDLSISDEAAGFTFGELGKVRFFLGGEPALAMAIRDAVFLHAESVCVAGSQIGQPIDLPADVIRMVGFQENEQLLSEDACLHGAYRLLLEYFAFPDKFRFLEIDLGQLAQRVPPTARTLQIRIRLNGTSHASTGAGLLDRIDANNFMLHCSPMVNLFSQAAEPIRITGTSVHYPIVVDVKRPHAYPIYGIRHVRSIERRPDGIHAREIFPLFSLRHGMQPDGQGGDAAIYWHTTSGDIGQHGTVVKEIMLVAPEDPAQLASVSSLSIDLVCTNGDLPAQLGFGPADGGLTMEGGAFDGRVQFVTKPTGSHGIGKSSGIPWRLISHLSLNYLSLCQGDAAALKEMLCLYDLSRSATSQKQIAGLIAIARRPVTARLAGNPFPAFVRGLEIQITVNEENYTGGGLGLFTQVLDHFFALYVHANSYTQLVMMSRQSGKELIRCLPRNGQSILA